MAEGSQNTVTSTQTDPVVDPNPPANADGEKKYTDKEMNDIVKKNSEKEVNKLLKELGITDRAKAKEILAEYAAKNPANAGNTEPSSHEKELESALRKATEETQNAILENIFLSQKVNSAKVSKAVRLIDREACLDDDGKFSREKVENAVKELLKEWPELISQSDSAQVGFKIGAENSNGQQTSAAVQSKKPVQKGWNRFNN